MTLVVDLSHLPMKASRWDLFILIYLCLLGSILRTFLKLSQEARNQWNDQRAALVQGSLLPTTQRINSVTPSSCSTSLATGYSDCGHQKSEVLDKPSRARGQDIAANVHPARTSKPEPMQLLLSNFLSRQKGEESTNPSRRRHFSRKRPPANKARANDWLALLCVGCQQPVAEAGAGINRQGPANQRVDAQRN